MHRHTIVSGLLISVLALGWGCAPEPEQASAPAETQVRAAFVSTGPIPTKEDAVETVIRYVDANRDQYIRPRLYTTDGVENMTFSLATDRLPTASNVWDAGTQWLVAWEMRDPQTPSSFDFAVDKASGAVRIPLQGI